MERASDSITCETGQQHAEPARQSTLDRLTPPSDDGTNRLDIDEADGRPRFYGPTSQLHIQRHSVPIESPSDLPFGIDIDSSPLQIMLLNTYWKIQPHAQIIVDEGLFEHGRDFSVRSEYYSAFLQSAILACATRMSTSEAVRGLGVRYAERAKSYIAQELEDPNTATLQGFLLLSDFEATRGRDRLGYLYCGIGCRLVFDLGLPENCTDLIARGKLSPSEARWRHTLFLGAFVFDKLWSLYTGRPGSVPTSILEAAHNRSLVAGWTGPATLGPWVVLCADISEITDILNNSTTLDNDAKARLADLDSRVQRHHESLPPSLMLQRERVYDLPASAYSLHIQLHGIRIVLHRLLHKAACQHMTDPNGGPPDAQTSLLAHSRAIMYENAMDIAELVSVYQQIYGIEGILTIMLDNSYIAAAMLISHVLRGQQTKPSSDRELQRLRSLADMLLKAEKHYPVTVRMRFTLSKLVNNTALAGLFGYFAKQPANSDTANNVTTVLQNHLVDLDSDRANQELAGSQDMQVFADFNFEDSAESRMFQEMDLQNMMSWVLSPNALRTGTPRFASE
ncbi:hypothetical protein LTR37_000872 [Vermiconidia calcicola]|uniref:Uncharacterized protein n=1 Tax=Vermiconidia calcicola TaxID=1690605 RepID=A0ACC3NXN8_9PEZI|nr:hypothetical protein LTR37_000872 [Vermiconidia calcicola]